MAKILITKEQYQKLVNENLTHKPSKQLDSHVLYNKLNVLVRNKFNSYEELFSNLEKYLDFLNINDKFFKINHSPIDHIGKIKKLENGYHVILYTDKTGGFSKTIDKILHDKNDVIDELKNHKNQTNEEIKGGISSVDGEFNKNVRDIKDFSGSLDETLQQKNFSLKKQIPGIRPINEDMFDASLFQAVVQLIKDFYTDPSQAGLDNFWKEMGMTRGEVFQVLTALNIITLTSTGIYKITNKFKSPKEAINAIVNLFKKKIKDKEENGPKNKYKIKEREIFKNHDITIFESNGKLYVKENVVNENDNNTEGIGLNGWKNNASKVELDQELINHLKELYVFDKKLHEVLTNETTSMGSSNGGSPVFSNSGGGFPVTPLTNEPIKRKIEEEGIGSVGAYDTPGFASSEFFGNKGKKGKAPVNKGVTHKKPMLPGNKFVEVKDKCKKFPYCNQGPEAITIKESYFDNTVNLTPNEFKLFVKNYKKNINSDILIKKINDVYYGYNKGSNDSEWKYDTTDYDLLTDLHNDEIYKLIRN